MSVWERVRAAGGDGLDAGSGPELLASLLADADVDEVLVNGPSEVWVEREGMLAPAAVRFQDAAALRDAAVHLAARAGRRLDDAEPMVDARLPDGSRLHAVLPPLAPDGPVVAIRRFRPRPLALGDLVARGSLDAADAELLRAATRARLNLVIAGGTSSGKTTLLAALVGCAEASDRIVTVEDAAELRIDLPHVVRLEGRPPSLEGTGAVTIRALVRSALRLRPDRLVVGEVRGGEALDMLQAMNTGHDGSLTTVHANTAADALRRIETMAMLSGVEVPHAAVREQVASAVQVVVLLQRLRTGMRRVTDVAGLIRDGAAGWDLGDRTTVAAACRARGVEA